MPLLPGEILNKRYRIVSLLGTGPYGATYRGWDISAELDVAIKEYRDPSLETQKRFRAEARRLNRLQHPGLPAYLDHFSLEESGQFLVSQYIEGVDLGTLLQQYGPLPSDLIIPWLQEASQALAYLHEQGQLHLDIKPANMRLTPAGDVFLVDNGLQGLGIRPHDSAYGSPEQQAQRDVTETADIYSLGATLYTLLTAEDPPNALSRESGLQELTPAREVNPNVEPYLSIVASRAMSLRPDTRYDSAADFAKALARPSGHQAPQKHDLRRTEETAALSPPAPRHPPSRRRQIERRTILGLFVILLIVIAAGIGFGVMNIGGTAQVTEAEATATLESAVISALTALAPTETPLPLPTQPPTPTPEPFITATGSRMIFIPGGIFTMGDNDADKRDQQPGHLVRLDGYYIDETEVTNGEYAVCVAAGACDPPDSPNATYHENYYGNAAFDDYPVLFMKWYHADTFCTWRAGRLPTEAEWEKAAGFNALEGIRTIYPWGEDFDGTRLNFCDKNCPRDFSDGAVDDGHRDTAPVGSYPDGRSPTGIYDMSGNVMEWVADWYDSRYYEESTDTNPLGPIDGQFKVLRGGSWLSPAEDTTVIMRDSFDPLVSRANIGFRCAMTPP